MVGSVQQKKEQQMSKDTPTSRLAARAARGGGMPVKGLGSGYAANQALAGVRDPEMAAKLAAMSPEQLNEWQDEQRDTERKLEEQRAYLLEAVTSGKWKPTGVGDIEGMQAWANLFSEQEPELIARWHREAESAVHDEIDEQSEEELAAGLSAQLAIQPDSPLYDPMQDKERRKRIELELEELEFEDMVFKGFLEQTVPLRENYKLTFRTLYTSHGMWLEWYIGRDTQSEDTFQYQRHRFSMLMLAASLHSVNGKPIGPDLSKFMKETDRDQFIAAVGQRMEVLGRMPAMLTDDLIVQSVWFNGRVQKLLAGNLMEKVGNS